MVSVINSPIVTPSKYSTILFWKSEFGSIIQSLISCGDNEFRIQRSMCKCKVSLSCCSTVVGFRKGLGSNVRIVKVQNGEYGGADKLQKLQNFVRPSK